MDCSECGGAFLGDSGACTCKDKEIKKLKKEIKDLKRMWFATLDGDEQCLPVRLQKRVREILGDY
jgi:hypothetical protein